MSSNAAYIPTAQNAIDLAFVDQVKDKLDFVGLDYYYGASLDNPTAVHAASGEFWKVTPQPDGIYYALRYYARKFPGLPIYIVENGMPTDNAKRARTATPGATICATTSTGCSARRPTAST